MIPSLKADFVKRINFRYKFDTVLRFTVRTAKEFLNNISNRCNYQVFCFIHLIEASSFHYHCGISSFLILKSFISLHFHGRIGYNIYTTLQTFFNFAVDSCKRYWKFCFYENTTRSVMLEFPRAKLKVGRLDLLTRSYVNGGIILFLNLCQA